MRRVPLEYIREGHYNAKAVYTDSGQLLIAPNIKLTSSYIEKLKAAGYYSLYIQDEYCTSELDEKIKPRMQAQMLDISKKIGKLLIEPDNAGRKKSEVSNYIMSFERILDQLIYDLLNDSEVVNNLYSISMYDDFTFNHSLNMMTISLAMGKELGLPMDQLKNLAIGSVFHDLGKMFIPKEILNKPGKLTEEEFLIIKEHPNKGYTFMKDYTNLPAVSRVIALEHHEKIDGSGYPDNKSGNEINRFSKICAISDVFEALVADRPYRRAVDIGNAREYILGGGGSSFDMNMVKCFSKAINPYPVDTRVRLSDDREGVITKVNGSFYTRPIVTIYCEEGSKVIPYEVDLLQTNNLVINDTIYLFNFEMT